MIDIKSLGLNTICPVCGEEIRMIDIHINSYDGVQRINGRCIPCGTCFEVNKVDDLDEDIDNKWNRIFESAKIREEIEKL